MSVARVPRCSPVSPPIVKRKMKANAKHIGVVKLIDPLYMVASQLKTLMADGTDTVKVRALKMMVVIGPIPAVNM